MVQFVRAVKKETRLRLAISGPAGSGKTYTALRIATGMVAGLPNPDGRNLIALVDTEHGSASKYSDIFRFDVLELEAPFHPDRFVEAIQAAGEAGYDVLILDSLTHAWSGPGGLLEIVDEIAARMKTTNTFAAWKDATPIQNRLVEAILGAKSHVIATMRSKQDYVQERDEKSGRTVIRKVGMAPQQREGFEYEFDVFGDMDIDNRMIISKTRCPELTGRVFAKPGKELAEILGRWLQGQPATAQTSPAEAERDREASMPGRGEELRQPAAQLGSDYKTAPRPWTAEQVIQALRDAAQAEAERATRSGEPTRINGTFGATIDIMECIGVNERKAFLRHVFNMETSKALAAAQKHALVRWCKPGKAGDKEPWTSGNPHFAQEFRNVVDPQDA